MKRSSVQSTLTLILILNLAFTSLHSQPDLNIRGVSLKKINSIGEGKSITILGFGNNESGEYLKIEPIEKEDRLSFSALKSIQFTPASIKEFWKIQALKSGVYTSLAKNGYQYKIRKQIEEEALDVIDYYTAKGLIFDDSYLESYIYSLVIRLFPDQMNDGRPGIINVKIIKDISPNAWVYPNGTLFVSTGLISSINTEEELLGVLAHEISHFVLDHSIINYNKAVQRQKRAEFWAGLAAVAGVVADAYVSSKTDNYSLGTISLVTTVLAYSVAESINERLGLKYSRDQELEADRSAVAIMKFIKMRPTALTSALLKIKTYFELTGNYMALSGEGTHPAIEDRIKEIGYEGEFDIDKLYEKNVSIVNSYTSKIEFYNRHFINSVSLLKRNIAQSVACEEDYILLAKCYMYLYDSQDKNIEALTFLNKAKEISVQPCLDLFKTEALVLLRLNRKEEAKNALQKYKSLLESNLVNKTYVKVSDGSYGCDNYLCREIEWTNKLTFQLRQM